MMLHTAVHLYGSGDVPSGLLADCDSPKNHIITTDAAVQPGDLQYAHDRELEHGVGIGGTGNDKSRRRGSVGQRRSSESVTTLIDCAAASDSDEPVDDHAATQASLVRHEHRSRTVTLSVQDSNLKLTSSPTRSELTAKLRTDDA
jgi:hypothetical protein